jgi:hypothetical protein
MAASRSSMLLVENTRGLLSALTLKTTKKKRKKNQQHTSAFQKYYMYVHKTKSIFSACECEDKEKYLNMNTMMFDVFMTGFLYFTMF